MEQLFGAEIKRRGRRPDLVKRELAGELRQIGFSYRKIGKALGVSGPAAYWLVHPEARTEQRNKRRARRLRLTDDERQTLEWLGQKDYSQYGECCGSGLDGLIRKGLAQVHKGLDGQYGFISQGDTLLHRAVSLTESGYTILHVITKSKAA